MTLINANPQQLANQTRWHGVGYALGDDGAG